MQRQVTTTHCRHHFFVFSLWESLFTPSALPSLLLRFGCSQNLLVIWLSISHLSHLISYILFTWKSFALVHIEYKLKQKQTKCRAQKFILLSLSLIKEMRSTENFRKRKKTTFHIFLRLYSFSTASVLATA